MAVLDRLSMRFNTFSIESFQNVFAEQQTTILQRIYDIFYQTLHEITPGKFLLSDLQEKIIVHKSTLQKIDACLKLLSKSYPYCIDSLNLDCPRSTYKKKITPLLNALALEMPVIPSASIFNSSSRELHKEFYQAKSFLDLQNRALFFTHRFLQALDFYKTTLHHLSFVTKTLKNPMLYQYGYIPEKTKYFILRRTITNSFSKKLKKIGYGGNGQVHLIQEGLQQFALKTSLSFDTPDLFFQFECGINLLLPRHPSITELKALSSEGLFLELANNRTLYHTIYNQPQDLSYKTILHYFTSIAHALSIIHDLGFNYKDLKPNNILLFSSPQQAKLCDFGFITPSHIDTELDVQKYYCAPEYFNFHHHKTITPKADCWSFGITLFETLTGEFPFSSPTAYKRWSDPCTETDLLQDLSANGYFYLQQRDPQHLLLPLVLLCLHAPPSQRPSSSEIHLYLHSLRM